MKTKTQKLILASRSPRRSVLLEQITKDFEVIPSSFEEKLDCARRPEENALIFARSKAECIAKDHPDCWVIGADTLVAVEHEILGKPKDKADAQRMLKKLSGMIHFVITGICIVGPLQTKDRAVTTEVSIKTLTNEEIVGYIATGEPMDKAGAYAIQGKGKFLVRDYFGSYSNIVGLPLGETKILLKKTGFQIPGS